ncbi:MAG: hypothetical protein IIA60_01000 [Candidatus Marinimicrobia bacterium]|nr:hypothetical protein [Candidatus Neomarinimicrobiota bacterium]
MLSRTEISYHRPLPEASFVLGAGGANALTWAALSVAMTPGPAGHTMLASTSPAPTVSLT